MCGRFSIASESNEIVQRFAATLPAQGLTKRFNAAPSQALPIINSNLDRTIQLFRWGLIPSWSKKATNMINARGETIAEKPSFRSAFRKRRCLVIADSFYEWKRAKNGKKRPVRFLLSSQALFAFAGVWEKWKSPEGEEIHSFAIITTEANKLVANVHDRMPVILAPENEAMWLDSTVGSDDLQELLTSYPAEQMKSYLVSPELNSAKNDNPSLLQEVVHEEQAELFNE